MFSTMAPFSFLLRIKKVLNFSYATKQIFLFQFFCSVFGSFVGGTKKIAKKKITRVLQCSVKNQNEQKMVLNAGTFFCF